MTPSQAEATRGRSHPAPRPATAATIRSWRPFHNPAGTVLGYLDVELPSGMVINGSKLMVGPNGKHWVAMPSERQLDRDGNPRLDDNGKQLWSPIVEFATRDARGRFNELVLAALRRKHPGAFDQEASRGVRAP
jgi:DNA-binding cell septation regulator SpoVG